MEKNKVNKKTQGKKSRAAGQRFELKVRKDLESKGWIVDKWTNNIKFTEEDIGLNEDLGNGERFVSDIQKAIWGKLIPAKHKFRGPGIPMAIGTGFPDFITFRTSVDVRRDKYYYDVVGVECKSNGYLDKEEKEKCKWLLDNHIFSKIIIAKKGKKRGEIIYKDLEE